MTVSGDQGQSQRLRGWNRGNRHSLRVRRGLLRREVDQNAAEVASTTCMPVRRPGCAESPRGLGRSQRPEGRCPPCARWHARGRPRRPGPLEAAAAGATGARSPRRSIAGVEAPGPGSIPGSMGRILVCQRPRRQVPCMTPARMHRRRDRCHCGTGPRPAGAHHGTVARAMAMRLLFPWVSSRGPCQSQCRGFRANLKVGLLR